jgi:hypothetical protein
MQVILKYSGSDCSEDLALHSTGAQALWQRFCIGVLGEGKFLQKWGGSGECANEVRGECQLCRSSSFESSSSEPCPQFMHNGGGELSRSEGGSHSEVGGGDGDGGRRPLDAARDERLDRALIAP